jgi:hypothetical protein
MNGVYDLCYICGNECKKPSKDWDEKITCPYVPVEWMNKYVVQIATLGGLSKSVYGLIFYPERPEKKP